MSGLVLRLRPHEKVLVNGVMLENGDRRARLRVRTNDANILRFRDALHPDDVNTPAKRAYYLAQLVVAGDAGSEEAQAELLPALASLREAFGDKICGLALDAAIAAASEGKFYNVMRQLARVLPLEAALLNVQPPGGQK